MTRSIAVLAAVLGIAASTPSAAVAQRYSKVTVSDQPQKLDATQQRYHDLLIALRDTLQTVTGAAVDLQHDLRTSGGITILSRAARLRDRCDAARAELRTAFPEFTTTGLPREAHPKLEAMSRSAHALDEALRQECLVSLAATGPGAHADSLRAWAPYRVSRLRRAIIAYTRSAFEFAHAAGFRLEGQVRK